MDFHYVDTAGPRFLQAFALFVFRVPLDPSHLKNAFDQLLLAWPVLQKNVNFARTGAFSTHDTTTHWQSKDLNATMAEHIPVDYFAKEGLDESQRQLIEKLFQFPQSLKSHIFPPVCRIQAVFFQDGCLVKFTVQHVFCDGAGLFSIVSAFASLLRGETIQPIDETRPSEIVFQAPREGCKSPDPLSEEMYQATFRQWATGVSGMVCYGIAQWLARAFFRNQRSLRTMHIPGYTLDRLEYLAKQQQVHVTRHDLLMAMIVQATVKAFPCLEPTPIGFIYNFSHQLQQTAPLHNTFWPISISLPQKPNKLRSCDDQLIRVAAHVRRAVRVARSPECLELFRKRYEAMGPYQPLYPADLNPNKPNIQVSSSSHQDWYGIEFGDGVKPHHTHVHVPVIDLFASVGLNYHDLILTTKDKDKSGFCIHGSLHTKLWQWLEHIRDSSSVPAPIKVYARL